jgi:hypothetical protein
MQSTYACQLAVAIESHCYNSVALYPGKLRIHACDFVAQSCGPPIKRVGHLL